MRPLSLFLPLVILSLELPASDRLDDPPQLPEGVIARVGDDEISLEEYKRYLFDLAGFKHLSDLIYGRLLEEEAQRLNIVIEQESLEARWAEELRTLQESFGGDRAKLLSALEETGYGEEGSKRRFMVVVRPQMLEERIAVVTRQIQEPDVIEYFNRNFGEGGVKVVLRHIMMTRARMKSDLVASRVPVAELSNARLDTEINGKAIALLTELRNGADFESIARRESADLSARQNGGTIPKYNYKHYGEALAQAVRAATVGVVSGPVQSPSGVHIFVVEQRIITQLEETRPTITAALLAAPAKFSEIVELKRRLMSKYEIQWPK